MRVLAVADNPLARSGLAAALADEEGLEVVAEVDRASALEAVSDLLPGAIVVDTVDADAKALEWLAELVSRARGAPVIGLGEPSEGALAAIHAGAAAVLPADADGAVVHSIARMAGLGLVALRRADVDALAASEQAAELDDVPLEALTPRESEVLQLLAQGLTTGRIAHTLEISDHTVKFHVTAIMGKLGASTRAQAVARAARLGWILA